MWGFTNVNIAPEGKKKVRCRHHCFLVVVLIISSTCLMSVILSFSWFCAHSVHIALSVHWEWHVCVLRFLKLESIYFKHMHLDHFLLPASSLLYKLMTHLLEKKLLLCWFLIRFHCGLWLFPRSEHLFSILPEKSSASLLIKTEKSSITLKYPVQTNLQIPQYWWSKNNNNDTISLCSMSKNRHRKQHL